MCNRYRMTASRVETLARFGVNVEPDPERLPPPELFPKRPAYVVREHDGARVLDIMTWGFPRPLAARAPVTNVRNLDSLFWQSALQRPDRRCLVPATDFCEWEGEKGEKVARWFSCNGRAIFAFAGVWRPTDDGGAFAFLTCDPNPPRRADPSQGDARCVAQGGRGTVAARGMARHSRSCRTASVAADVGRLMSRSTRHELEGLLLRRHGELVLEVGNGGTWRLELSERVEPMLGRRVTLTGVRIGFDLLDVHTIALVGTKPAPSRSWWQTLLTSVR